jgi:hypothetical protein
MTTAKAEATQLLVARESALGTAPSSGWLTVQPNPSGIQGFSPEYVDVARDPLSTFATDEKGDHVGLKANPVLVHDLNIDLAHIFAEGWLRSDTKVPGDEGLEIYRPTAVVDGGGSEDSFTVAASGDLANGTLVVARGFVNSANNGLFLLSGTPTDTAIKTATATLVAETVSPTGSATVEVCGVQGGTADIVMNASGYLTSTVLDFTTLNLVVGHRIKIGDGSNAAYGFATAACNGWATVKTTPTANLIELKWHSFTPAADAGTGKTIRLFFGRCLRNVALDHADYLEPSWHFEKEDLGVGTANASVFTYAEGSVINTVSISLPLQSKVEVTTNFVGMDITDPVLAASRVSGPSSAFVPVATDLFDTSNDLFEIGIYDADDQSTLVAEVNSATITFNHGVTPREQLATFGAAGMIFGKIRPSASTEIYYERATVPTAIRDNTTCRFAAAMKNGQGAIRFDLPTITLRGGAMTYAANSPVMINLEMPAHRDPTTNIVAICNVMPYVPAS